MNGRWIQKWSAFWLREVHLVHFQQVTPFDSILDCWEHFLWHEQPFRLLISKFEFFMLFIKFEDACWWKLQEWILRVLLLKFRRTKAHLLSRRFLHLHTLTNNVWLTMNCTYKEDWGLQFIYIYIYHFCVVSMEITKMMRPDAKIVSKKTSDLHSVFLKVIWVTRLVWVAVGFCSGILFDMQNC